MAVDPIVKHSLQLNALKTFESAARLGGFSQAAAELKVTPGAVAAQIKALEAQYGALLFERSAKSVTLTALGEIIAAEFIEAFDAIEEAARHFRALAQPHRVHVATLPSIAALWIGPRLPKLTTMLAPIEISVTAVEVPPNLKRSPYDLCLFYTDHLERGHRKLANEEVLPVCVPALAAELKSPRDLLGAKCIAEVGLGWNDWEIWTREVMPDTTFVANGPGFSLYSIAVQQALLGAGVLIGRRSLIQPYLDSGELVAPFSDAVPNGLMLATWTVPTNKGNRALSTVENALLQMA